ncbi:MAG: PQQ-binding-like beta-propeller repeat protein, partial [Deltaproteobacteria bacterium]|nr:PQQ-binding-like beta-propeller repeat protein [Deltaproteobacteria bacterium]
MAWTQKFELLFVWFLLAGCGGAVSSAFSSSFDDNRPARISRIAARLSAAKSNKNAKNYLSKPLLAATTDGKQPEIILFDIASSTLLWRRAARADSRPEIMNDSVVAVVDGRVTAFDLRTGSTRWRFSTEGLQYLGAAQGSSSIIYSMSGCFSAGESFSLITARDSRSGKERWRYRVSGRLGRPAATAGLVLVPWDRQKIAVLDESTGDEKARLRSLDDVITWVTANGKGVFFGDRAIYRLTPKGYRGTKSSAPYLAQPFSGLPANPSLWENAYTPQPGGRSALGRIRILFEIDGDDSEKIRIAGDCFYLLFYRYLFKIDLSGAVAWSRVFNDDVVASQSIRGGVISVTETGAIELTDGETGEPRYTTRIPHHLESASVDAGGLADLVSRSSQASAAGLSLREQLVKIALDPDNRLVLARIFATRQLAQLPPAEVTRDLLDIYAQSGLPPAIKGSVAQLLRKRRTGRNYLLDELSQHADFLSATRPPDFSLIVPALIELREKKAAPSLIQHLFDYATPMADLPVVISGIVELGDSTLIPLLKAFIQQYRSDSSFDGSEKVLLAAADGLLRYGGPEERSFLLHVADRPSTLRSLASGIRARLDAATRSEITVARDSGRDVRTKPPKARREQASINATFAEHADEIRECIIQEIGRNPELAQVRIAFIVNRDGSAHAFRFVPHNPEFVACLEPKVRRYRFPPAGVSRQLASYVIAL